MLLVHHLESLTYIKMTDFTVVLTLHMQEKLAWSKNDLLNIFKMKFSYKIFWKAWVIISLLFFPAYCRLCTFQFSSVTQLCPTLCDPMYRTMPGLTVHHQLMSIESMMASNPLILCHSLLLLSSIFPRIRVVSNELGLCIRWPKYWNFSFSISPSNEHPGLISFRWIGWISLQFKGLSRVFSSTTVQKHQFFGAQLSSQSNSHIHTWPLEKS